MQERQASILMQQQSQTEVLMKQIQAQMESELKAKSDLVRNQLTILTEIQVRAGMLSLGLCSKLIYALQMQNPNESLDMKGLLDQVQQSVGVSKISMQSNGSNKDKCVGVLCHTFHSWC